LHTTTAKLLVWVTDSWLKSRLQPQSIEQYPEIAPITEEGVQAKVLVKFPYSLMYIVEEHEVYIVAVAHQSKRPAYWADRLPAGG
jgi:hypothetical protein